jgi:sec-independent protein translocase protein TatA
LPLGVRIAGQEDVMGELSPWHWIVVLLIFALLFGSKKLPDAARGLGRSMRIFKAEMQSAKDEFGDARSGEAPVASAAPMASATPTVAPVEDAVPPFAAQPVMNVTPEPMKPAVEI